MPDFIGPLLIAILSSGSLAGAITFVLTRRKYKAEIENIESETGENKAQEADTFAGTIQKMIGINDQLQEKNSELYRENVALEKALTDSDRGRENLTLRLQARDDQITTLNEQLRRLHNRDQQSEISQALQAQLAGITEIKGGYERIIQERDRTIKELLSQTGRLPPLPEKDKK